MSDPVFLFLTFKMLIYFDNDNNNILPTLYSELVFLSTCVEQPSWKWTVQPHRVGKWTFDDDDDDDDDFCLLTF